jgi:hypothetical protein
MVHGGSLDRGDWQQWQKGKQAWDARENAEDGQWMTAAYSPSTASRSWVVVVVVV